MSNSTWTPEVGPKISAAWHAIRSSLETNGQVGETTLIAVATHTGIVEKTATNLLRDLCNHGYLRRTKGIYRLAQPHAGQTTGNDPMQRAQEARLARYAELLERKFYDFSGGGCYSMPDIARHVMALADAEVLAAVSVAKSEMAQCVAERDQARAEVVTWRERSEGWRRGYLRQLEHTIQRERERNAAQALVAQARTWIANCVDPAAVGIDEKRRMLAALAAEPTPPAAPQPIWVNEPAPGGLICSACLHPIESEPCAEHGTEPAPVADPSGTGETR